MAKFFYYLKLFAGSALAVAGIRADEESAYTVLRKISPDVEIRAYAKRVAVETETAGNDNASFERLFQYIAGANRTHAAIAMTAPVQESTTVAMTVPVEISGQARTMRFFLPRDVAAKGAPAPTDARVHLVEVPAMTLGVLRYSGFPTAAARAEKAKQLRAVLEKAGVTPDGPAMDMLYDPPFTLPFLRRNEVAVTVTEAVAGAGAVKPP